ncbi:glycerol-3-phosphate dehydrogenase/oxidase [candidate division KSB1 bacterium]|nr:glycerol-3-phosphate dehydrogenase/oxidase [candidate division KSB1 bacterium]
MQRNPAALSNSEFDLLIIGGGVYGAATAWDASLRGLKVALIEKGDFASGTSGNSLKIIHGGLRYLQHGDIKRLRESVAERKNLLHIAPHLIHPLPCIMPTYGHFIKGPEVLGIAMIMNDSLSLDRNWGMGRRSHLPAGKVISKQKLLQYVPFVDRTNLTGGAVWYDAQMHNSERLTLCFLLSAAEQGVQMANYVKANGFLQKNGQIFGVQARDSITGERFDIHARMTLNCSGPWINNMFNLLDGGRLPLQPYSTAMNLVIKRSLSESHAFGISSKKVFQDKDALISKGSRLLFVVPWRGYTLIGTEHKPFTGDAEHYRVGEGDIEAFLQDVNDAMPGADIRREEVCYFYGGLLPMDGVHEKSGNVQLQKHFSLVDHEDKHGIKGLVTVMSVKYTTARGVAESAINLVMQKLGRPVEASPSRRKPLWGGDIGDFDYWTRQIFAEKPKEIDEAQMRHLSFTYGSGLRQIIALGKENRQWLKPVAGQSLVLKAEVINAVRHEMAFTLADVIRRRTELGSAERPNDATLMDCAGLMAGELKWDQKRMEEEIEACKTLYVPA